MTKVLIDNIQVALENPEMLADCLAKANRYENVYVEIFTSVRSKTGWLEWHVVISSNGSKLLIGAIQRTVGAKTEFHS